MVVCVRGGVTPTYIRSLTNQFMSDTHLAFTHNSKLAKSEPEWGTVNKSELPRLAFARKGEADKKSSWGFGHHWVQGGADPDKDGILDTGTLYLHKGGLNAAWSAAMGGRSGQKAEPAVIAHLRKHFSDLGIKKAALQALSATLDVEVDIEALDAELIAGGFLTAEDLAPLTPEARIRAMIDKFDAKVISRRP